MKKIFLPILLVLAGGLPAESLPRRITGASAVIIRSGPTVNSTEVARLKLGTIIDVTGKSPRKSAVGRMTDFWYQVKTKDKTGWIFGGLLREYRHDNRENIFLGLARERLKRKSDSFLEWTELFDFCGTAAGQAKSKDARAELELCRLLAASRACDSRPEDPWFQANTKILLYHELAGQFILNADVMWKLRKKYKRTPVAERIAYEASRLMLPGECEGFLECNLGRWMMTQGRYLELYPAGVHTDEMLSGVEEIARYHLKQPRDGGGGEDLIDQIDRTIKLIKKAKTTGDRKERAIQLLTQIRTKYDKQD